MKSSLADEYPLMDIIENSLPSDFLETFNALPIKVAIVAAVVSGMQIGMLIGMRHPTAALKLLDSSPKEIQGGALDSMNQFMRDYEQSVG